MLVDLEWDIKYYSNPNVKILSFDTKDGGLTIKIDPKSVNLDFDGVIPIAERLQKGVYYISLVNEIELYTKYNIDYSTEWESPIEMYGTADTLEQILEHGKTFIEDSSLYVLALNEINQKNCGDFRFRKNGIYIGKKKIQYYLRDTPKIEKIILFHFYKLVEKVNIENLDFPGFRDCRVQGPITLS